VLVLLPMRSPTVEPVGAPPAHLGTRARLAVQVLEVRARAVQVRGVQESAAREQAILVGRGQADPGLEAAGTKAPNHPMTGPRLAGPRLAGPPVDPLVGQMVVREAAGIVEQPAVATSSARVTGGEVETNRTSDRMGMKGEASLSSMVTSFPNGSKKN